MSTVGDASTAGGFARASDKTAAVQLARYLRLYRSMTSICANLCRRLSRLLWVFAFAAAYFAGGCGVAERARGGDDTEPSLDAAVGDGSESAQLSAGITALLKQAMNDGILLRGIAHTDPGMLRSERGCATLAPELDRLSLGRHGAELWLTTRSQPVLLSTSRRDTGLDLAGPAFGHETQFRAYTASAVRLQVTDERHMTLVLTTTGKYTPDDIIERWDDVECERLFEIDVEPPVPDQGTTVVGLMPATIYFDEPVVTDSVMIELPRALRGSVRIDAPDQEFIRSVKLTPTSPWPEGVHYLNLGALTDAGGNAGANASYTIEVLPLRSVTEDASFESSSMGGMGHPWNCRAMVGGEPGRWRAPVPMATDGAHVGFCDSSLQGYVEPPGTARRLLVDAGISSKYSTDDVVLYVEYLDGDVQVLLPEGGATTVTDGGLHTFGLDVDPLAGPFFLCARQLPQVDMRAGYSFAPSIWSPGVFLDHLRFE